jgi:tetratricopeptide (TPR) repeat protein
MSSEKIALLKSFLEADPHDGFTRFALAMELRKSGDIVGSEATYRELMALDPNYVGLYYHLGRLLEDLKRFDEAREIYSLGVVKAMELKDNHSASELRQALEELD